MHVPPQPGDGAGAGAGAGAGEGAGLLGALGACVGGVGVDGVGVAGAGDVAGVGGAGGAGGPARLRVPSARTRIPVGPNAFAAARSALLALAIPWTWAEYAERCPALAALASRSNSLASFLRAPARLATRAS